MASAHVILKQMRQRLSKGGCQSGRKVVPQNSKSDLPPARADFVIFGEEPHNQLIIANYSTYIYYVPF